MALLLLFCWFLQYCAPTCGATVCKDGDVRLRGGRNYREGRVEVCRQQQWGRVCDDEWDQNETAVVCRQLGLSGQDVIDYMKNDKEAEANTMLPFVLDDLGCNGSEKNLLDCLPQHNCVSDDDFENAGVNCSRKGVSLEHGLNILKNNSLVTSDDIGEGEEALFCSTDRDLCCNNSNDGSWYLPSGPVIIQRLVIGNKQPFYVTWGYQTVGLKYINKSSSNSLPVGIYHCEMMDEANDINHLYVGIYPQNEGHVNITSLNYDDASRIIMCTSTGGPATDVRWTKDSIDITVIADGELYEHSQVVISTASGTYENRLKIVNKSSKVAGTYTCEVGNVRGSTSMSLHLEVCRDMEIRFSNSSSEGVEVCVGDHWLVAAISAMTANGSRAAQNISIRVASLESTSAVLTWSPEVAGISRYDVSCQETTQGLNYRVKIVDASTAMIQINGLTPGTTYECCVTAHSNTHLPLDLKYSSCHTIRTLKSGSLCYSSGIIAVSISLSLSTLILLGVCVAMGIKIKLLIEGAKAKVPGASTFADEQTDAEHCVDNPIYTDFPEGNSEQGDDGLGYTDSLKYESITHATYEQVNSRPPHSSTGNIKFYKDESIKKCLLPADVNGGESPALMEHIDDDVVAEMCESSENCQCGVCQQLAWTRECVNSS